MVEPESAGDEGAQLLWHFPRHLDKEASPRQTGPMREATISRKTNETEIDVTLVVDGAGRYDIATGIGFFDHMLDQLAKHSGMDLTVRAKGDLHIDGHHTVEDVGIAIGQALRQALGDRRGITRYADAYLPMDEALTLSLIHI